MGQKTSKELCWKESKECKVYDPINYNINNMTYCGVKVTHNPYFNDNIN